MSCNACTHASITLRTIARLPRAHLGPPKPSAPGTPKFQEPVRRPDVRLGSSPGRACPRLPAFVSVFTFACDKWARAYARRRISIKAAIAGIASEPGVGDAPSDPAMNPAIMRENSQRAALGIRWRGPRPHLRCRSECKVFAKRKLFQASCELADARSYSPKGISVNLAAAAQAQGRDNCVRAPQPQPRPWIAEPAREHQASTKPQRD